MPGASSPAPPAAACAASAFGNTSTSPTRCSSLRPLAFSTMTSSRFPACAGFTSTPKIPGREGASTRNTSGWPAPPCRRTSTFPSVSALKESSRVRWIAKRDVPPTTSGGYSANSSVLSVHRVTLSGSGSSGAAAGTADRLQPARGNGEHEDRAQMFQGHNVSPTARSRAICARRASSRKSILRIRAREAVRTASSNSRIPTSPSR